MPLGTAHLLNRSAFLRQSAACQPPGNHLWELTEFRPSDSNCTYYLIKFLGERPCLLRR